MTSPAAEARAKVKSAHPEAVVVERGRNSIKHRLADAPDGRKRFALDVAIGPLHYGPDNDQEIDTALVPSTAPWDWEMTKAGFEVRALSDLSAGQVIEYQSGSEWVRFQPHALQYSNDLNQIQQISMPQPVAAAVDDDTLTWADGYGPGRTLTWQAQTARLAKLLTINALSDLPAVQQFILDGGNPVLELNLIFAFSSGVTPYVNGQEWSRGDRDTQGLVEFRDGDGNVLWWFNLPRSWDSEGNEQLGTFRFKKQGNSLYVSHRVPLSFVQGAVYPLMVDVTVDEQVGASADDGYIQASSYFGDTSAYINIGYGGRHGWARFPGLSGLSGVTVDVAYYSVYCWWDSGNALTNVFAEDAEAPAAPTDYADYLAKSLTTAYGTFDGALSADVWENSDSIVTVLQELADSHDPSAIQIMHKDDGSAGTNRQTTRSYDYDTSLAPKLYIEFTAGGGGVTVTPPTATLTIATFVPVIKLVIIPAKRTLSLATFTPIVGLSVIPPPLALSLSTFAPTITVTENRLITPPTLVLSLAAFAPIIQLGVIPSTLTLSLSAFAPTATVSDNQAIVPPTLVLSLSAFAPVIGLIVVSPTIALSLSTFAPTVGISDNKLVTPPTLALSLSAFAPVATVTDNQTVAPPTVALSLVTFAPVVQLVIIPPTLALSLSAFAPTATGTGNVIVTPGVVALPLTAFEPVIQLGVIPPALALSLSAFAPIAVVTGDVVSTPPTLALSLVTFAPAVIVGTVITSPTLALSISAFAPAVVLGTILVIPTLGLSVATFVPTVMLPVTVTPPTVAITLTPFAPSILVGGAVVITPGTAALILATSVPVATASTYTSYGPPFLYTAANWGSSLEFFLEVYFKAVAGIVRARLYNATDGVVADSSISTTSTSYTRLRSGALSLTDGRVYFVQFGTEEVANGAFKGAKIIAI